MLSLWNPFYTDVSRSRKKDLLRDIFDTNYHWGAEYKRNDDGSLSVSLDLPGVEEKDISVEVTSDNLLQIRGQRKTATSSYSINKSFSVPDLYNTDHITAELKNGVLTFTLPTKQTVKDVKKVAITSVK
jgi:HSP20 family molecular chaperone IbpA